MSRLLQLLPDERVILRSASGALTLTNVRVRYEARRAGVPILVAIPLENVAAVAVVRRSETFLRWFAFLALLLGLAARGDAQAVLIVIAVVAALAFVFSGRSFLTVASTGTLMIEAPVAGMNDLEIHEYVDAIERESLLRRKSLGGRPSA